MSGVDPVKSPDLLCSFCSKSQQQVKKLIAGPLVYICDACVRLCNESRLPESPLPAQRCGFCGKNAKDVEKLWAGPTATICDECIGLCNLILAEEISRERPR